MRALESPVPSACALLLALLGACCGASNDTAAADTAAAIDAPLTPEGLIADRVVALCRDYPREVELLLDDSDLVPQTGSCPVRAEQYMLAYQPEGYVVPEIAEACIRAANASTAFDYWMWCFSAWQR